jgi:hypothetical protein
MRLLHSRPQSGSRTKKQIPRLCSGFCLRAHARKTAQLNKTFCYLFTQNGGLFEMIIRAYLS